MKFRSSHQEESTLLTPYLPRTHFLWLSELELVSFPRPPHGPQCAVSLSMEGRGGSVPEHWAGTSTDGDFRKPALERPPAWLPPASPVHASNTCKHKAICTKPRVTAPVSVSFSLCVGATSPFLSQNHVFLI